MPLTKMALVQNTNRRINTDIMKLIENRYEVKATGEQNEFFVKFYGPVGTPYEGGVWNVRVYLPEQYPFKSPSVGFMNRIYHPNIDEVSGAICLDVINQEWTALYHLSIIFETFLPQLLTYPNPFDPLNESAATLYLTDPEQYKKEVKDYIRRYATEEALKKANGGNSKSGSESCMSDALQDEPEGEK